MRRWRCFPVLARTCAALACAAPLPLTLGACAASLAPPQVSSIGAGAAGEGTTETAATVLRRQVTNATARFAALIKAVPGACAAPCLSADEEDAIIARAVAEHEMRRP